MILRRIRQAIVRQNWAAALLEVLIVVIGIFLGLQVDDWNENRKHRQQETVYLAKLADDLQAMRSDLVYQQTQREERIQRMSAALFALERCEKSEQAHADLKYAFERYQVSNGINFLDATHNEMVASGALARIDNPAIKQQIANTFSALGRVNDSMQSFRVSLPVVDDIVWRHISYSVDDRGRMIARFDLAQLCDQPELRNAIAEMVDIQGDGRAVLVEVLQMVDELSGLLEAGRPN